MNFNTECLNGEKVSLLYNFSLLFVLIIWFHSGIKCTFLPYVLFSVNMHTCLTLKLIVYSLGTVRLMSNFWTQNVLAPSRILPVLHSHGILFKSSTISTETTNWSHLCRMHFGDCRPSKTAASVVTTLNGIRATIGNVPVWTINMALNCAKIYGMLLGF